VLPEDAVLVETSGANLIDSGVAFLRTTLDKVPTTKRSAQNTQHMTRYTYREAERT
jgi:hypothetical protein